MEYNVYCDESCHLENDGINVMTLGAVWCPIDKTKEINTRIREIKAKHGIGATAELKWTKVSPSKLPVYQDLVDYFFDDDDLHFRGLLVPDKGVLDHSRFNQTHDDWYYKMYFDMLKVIFSPVNRYNIYVDIKDTHSHEKVRKLHEVCCNNQYDFSARIIKKIQPIRSNEVQIMQVVDVLIGAVAYRNRFFPEGFACSSAKQTLVNRIAERAGYKLSQTTLYRENKFNLLRWESNK